MDKATTLDDLEKKLQYHDWYYNYSDDYSAVRRGERSWYELKAMIESFPREDVIPLWDKHAPKEYKGDFSRYFPVDRKCPHCDKKLSHTDMNGATSGTGRLFCAECEKTFEPDELK